MTIPDSLQALGFGVFFKCSKLVPSKIIVSSTTIDSTSEVVAHLRYEMSLNALLSGNKFLNTDDFRRLIVLHLPNDALMTIRLASKLSRVADEFISDGVESGAMIVHGGKDVNGPFDNARKERRMLVTQVILLLNNMKIGTRACLYAAYLVVVDIPEGIERIGYAAFGNCYSLTTASFPTTLTSIDDNAFCTCSSLEIVDLLHTNLQELGEQGFNACSHLKSMTIPESLQTLVPHVFSGCSKLVPSNVNTFDTASVIAHLRSLLMADMTIVIMG
ncbi:hypothetical protein TL16_g02900 [Triparma laevis f. inornata]|uniref:Uncharacterized protein n=1 Tax=Triparma laevis f. inornata TaxID=1714386 RepID=A0A9W7DYH0_9STRA|nr:hypothetical protein TL16_g02900 [Triparma laevis f. inornata]